MIAAIAGSETEITVTANISVGSVVGHAFSIPTGRTVTLDLNGHTISAETSNGGVFSNAGTLTISDNSIAKGGMIINTNTTQTTTGEAAKSAISNTGVLTVNAGVIVAGPAEGQGSWPGENFNPAYGIDNLNGGDVTINGATISGAYGLRNFANANDMTITIIDGTITGKTGIAMQSFGTNVGTLIISGNTTITAERSAIYAAGVTQYNQIVINGGTFSGESENGTVCVVDGSLTINGGTFTGRNDTYSLTNYYAVGNVTAGTFNGNIYGGASGDGKTTFAPSAGKQIIVYGEIEGIVDGAGNVVLNPAVHNVTQNTYFYTIQAAIDAAAADGDVIEVGAGTYAEDLEIGKSITLLGPNAAISPNTGTRVAEAIIRPDNEVGINDSAIMPTANNIAITIKGITIDMVNAEENGHDRFVTVDFKTDVTMNFEYNQFINGPSPLYGAWYAQGNVERFNLSLIDNYFTGGTHSNGIALWGLSHTVNIRNNVWEDNDGWAMQFKSTKGTISGNQFVERIHDEEDTAWNATQLGIYLISPVNNSYITDLDITKNIFDGIYQYAIALGSDLIGDVDISENTFIRTAGTPDTGIRYLSISPGVDLTNVSIHRNSFLLDKFYFGYSGTETVDLTYNYWGSALGPQFPIEGDVQIAKWCADEGCTNFLPDDNGDVPIIGAPFTQTGAIKIYVDGVNYYLPAGTTIQNSSPCFEVYANDVMIYTDDPASATCVPTNGSDGIWVADGVENLRVINLEFDGTDQTTGSGIFFAGDAVGFQVVDNYFHDLDVSGVVFTGTPSGSTMDIQGNLFRDLGAAAIVSPAAINAEFNSWGVYAGATLTNVETEPHTHADFYMEYEGVIPLEKVAVGNTIKYTVYGNLQNISGADFTLKFPTAYLDAATPTNLSAFTSAGPAMFIVDDVAGTIRFQGDASMAPITGENLPIFEVVFTGTAAGTGAISFDLTNDVFAMFPGYGPSLHVYAAGYVDRTVEVFVDSAAPTLTSWTPAEGNIYLAQDEDFVLTVDALDDNLFSLEIDHNVIGLPEFTVYASATNVYGSTAAQTAFEAAGVTVTYDETTQTWTLTFNSAGSALAALLAKQDVVFYAVLHDQAGKTWGSMDPTTDENTFAYSIVFDNTAPALESWAPVKDVTYMLTPSGDFVLTVDALDVNLFGLELDHSLEGVLPEFWVYADSTDPYGGAGADFAAAGLEVAFNTTTQTWTLTFKDGQPALEAIIANNGITFYAVIHDLAGNTWGSMYTVTPDNTFAYTLYQQQPIARADSTGGEVVAVVSADGNTINFTGEVDWYPADPDLGRTSGHRIGVRLSAPELDFGTSDTTFTFNDQTYDWDLVKDGDDYVLVYPKVTAEIQTWEIVVTWGGGFSQTFTVNFDGTLGPVTAYTVEGEISMQGRVARNTEDVITLDGYMLDDFTADSLDKLGINYTLSNVLTGEYTIVTNQPRYLNIYCNVDSEDEIPDFCKKITLISDRTLPTLWLRGGNAIWTDNEITLDDANQVGTDWGSVLNPDGNVNFDSIVNIQDLALVGGNYGLTSASAYGTWLP